MTVYQTDRYYNYEELKEILLGWADTYRDILKVESIGKTYQGRDIYAATLTLGGDPDKKPGILIDGGLHSMEMIGSNCALYALFYFLENRMEAETKKILEEKTIYVLPRINCDGMEEDFYGRGTFRGSVRPFHKEEDGVTTEDIDGNGEILEMRILSPNGDYKCSKEDPRLMEPRTPLDTPKDGPFYYILKEGRLRGPKTDRPKQARNACDLDPNRQWPFDWDQDAIGTEMRPCAGPYPMYDCELRAVADFVIAHNNIAVDVNEHSDMGGYISPMEFFKEKTAPPDDSMLYESVGKAAHEETGYMYDHVFPIGLQGVAHGSFSPWLYYCRGIIAWCCENWTPKHMYAKVDREHPIEKMEPLMDPGEIKAERLAFLKWADENGESVFVPWHAFEHPELGPVEIGGFREYRVNWNPPVKWLEDECRRSLKFILRCIASAGQLSLVNTTVQKKDRKTDVTLVITNTGLFPLFGTRQALVRNMTTCGKAVLLKNGVPVDTRELPELYGKMTMPLVLSCETAEGDVLEAEITTERAGCLHAAIESYCSLRS